VVSQRGSDAYEEISVPTPGFPAGTLGAAGLPAWIDALEGEYPNYTVHVVRGLAPADALTAIGARAPLFMTCVLPGEQPDGQTSPAVFGQPGCAAVLLAGQVGDWTFVYDSLGDTESGEDPRRRGSFLSMAEILSAGDREAASSTLSINADVSLWYAVDGELLLQAVEEVDPERDDIPAGLQGAVEAAGRFEPAGDEADEDDGPDLAVNMRVVCALAGLNLTLEDLYGIPLIGAPLG
jgi:hypothetical protein